VCSNAIAAEMSDGQKIELEYDHYAVSKIDNSIIKLEIQHDLLGRVTSDKQEAIELKPLWRGGVLVGIASNVGLPVKYGRNANRAPTRVRPIAPAVPEVLELAGRHHEPHE
jgi:hypothetical protein